MNEVIVMSYRHNHVLPVGKHLICSKYRGPTTSFVVIYHQYLKKLPQVKNNLFLNLNFWTSHKRCEDIFWLYEIYTKTRGNMKWALMAYNRSVKS